MKNEPLQTNNEEWGFWGTSVSNGYDAALAWNTTSRFFIKSFDLTPDETRLLLDARFGRLAETFGAWRDVQPQEKAKPHHRPIQSRRCGSGVQNRIAVKSALPGNAASVLWLPRWNPPRLCMQMYPQIGGSFVSGGAVNIACTAQAG